MKGYEKLGILRKEGVRMYINKIFLVKSLRFQSSYMTQLNHTVTGTLFEHWPFLSISKLPPFCVVRDCQNTSSKKFGHFALANSTWSKGRASVSDPIWAYSRPNI